MRCTTNTLAGDYQLGAAYFNHRIYLAESWWDRCRFIANWQRIYAGDPYWTPPYYPTLNRILTPSQSPHLARQNPLAVYVEALPHLKVVCNHFTDVIPL